MGTNKKLKGKVRNKEENGSFIKHKDKKLKRKRKKDKISRRSHSKSVSPVAHKRSNLSSARNNYNNDQKNALRVDHNDSDNNDDSVTVGGGGGEIALSVEETNKLRAKLGLAPLKMDNDNSTVDENFDKNLKGETGRKVTMDGKEYNFYLVENMGDRKREESIREKLQARKDKRKIQEKLSRIKPLGEADDNDSAAAWVNHSRKLEEDKKMAQKREQLLTEMDEEFGVGYIVDDQIAMGNIQFMPKAKNNSYTSTNLAGMTVKHSKNAFVEERDTILVLEDRDILDEKTDDVLVNPTLIDEEKWKRNLELRKRKPNYNPYEDAALEEENALNDNTAKSSLLKKYDEVIEGEHKDSFQLDKSGGINIQNEQRLAEIRAKLSAKGKISLDAKPYQLASDFLSHEEMNKFKKFKKKVKKEKVRKRITGSLHADDLLAFANTADADFGSRDRGRGRQKERYETESNVNVDLGTTPMELVHSDVDDDDLGFKSVEFVDDDADFSKDLIDDEAEEELQAALDRTRKQRLYEAPEKLVLETVEKFDDNSEENECTSNGKSQSIVLNSVSEYCKSLGDIPSYNTTIVGTSKDEEKRKQDVYKSKHSLEDEYRREYGGWSEAKFNDELNEGDGNDINDFNDEDDPILGEEPGSAKGVVGALTLAFQKGYLEQEKNINFSMGKCEALKAQRYSVMDKQFADIDDKYARKLDRMGMGGPVSEFKDKTELPDFKLEYADESGHMMSQKEAFQYLSWKFHGKRPGKKKLEKMQKKRIEDQLLHQMSSTDTPLGTLNKQVEKQKTLQVPYIILSGQGARDVGTLIKKE